MSHGGRACCAYTDAGTASVSPLGLLLTVCITLVAIEIPVRLVLGDPDHPVTIYFDHFITLFFLPISY